MSRPKHLAADEHDRGLPYDLTVLMARRRMLGWLASAAAVGVLAGCGDSIGAQKDVVGTGPDGAECVADPEETTGPFPADGSNRAHGTLANVLKDSGIVREDMRSSFGKASGTAAGTPVELTLALVNVGKSCAPLAGHAIYLWHCDAEGRYSLYDLPDQTYLRAVGVTDEHGQVRFATIFPGCYSGRYPHMHFEVYPKLERAASYRNRLLTSQLAMPADICRAVYDGATAYRASIEYFAHSSIKRDGIFADNTPKQLAVQTPSLDGDPASGYRGTVTIGLKV